MLEGTDKPEDDELRTQEASEAEASGGAESTSEASVRDDVAQGEVVDAVEAGNAAEAAHPGDAGSSDESAATAPAADSPADSTPADTAASAATPAAATASAEQGHDYTVRLERVFSGPMDLLLHLVREQEVEIHEIEIHTIVGDYLGYLRALSQVDIESAGDFVVMAATLMAIKSRSLLPKEELDLEAELDPRDELIQRLVEYRRFRQSSELLEARWVDRNLLHSRGWTGELARSRVEPTLDLGEVTVFDLLAIWSRLQRETLANSPHRIAGDPHPMRFYVDRLVDRLRSDGGFSLRRMVESGYDEPATREHLVGSFCAILELVKLGVASVIQESTAGDIDIRMRDDLEAPIEDLLAGVEFEELDEARAASAEAELAAAGIELPGEGADAP
ncbi:segregation and condensation protein A [Engelhardtia mirabilis]|uniref:Segregation and condensation protein A n=1 Tax=Engelhardtia mirabilis TaxID=2528011 RepID=A0A518BD93_9BACT|nr:Segregation and condensation protein A [Planctomycetes bacterium Pla133]QDU99277.1 Segregation and condensation protein A [Planctomycetes bacterium Pla86]